ncbi:hypothetical protein [Chthonobacter rhizosphaerae]|nr:hypothetical protein [Chthonobacter rhizosphaerae]
MSSRPIFLVTLALAFLSMVDNGRPPKFPQYQVKAAIEVTLELRPDGEA